MKSIDELREIGTKVKNSCFTGVHCDAVLELADEIEAEMADNYMRLPADADGVLIHVGDRLECYANGYEGTFTVFAIGNDTVVGNHDIEWIRDNPYKWFHVASSCRHVKPRTLEDVLNEFGIAAARELNADPDGYGISDKTIAECVLEIRELLDGDEGGVVKR